MIKCINVYKWEAGRKKTHSTTLTHLNGTVFLVGVLLQIGEPK